MLDSPFSSFALFELRVLGIPVRVEATFVLATFLLAGGQRADAASFGIWLGVVFVSVLVHEIGHALVGQRFGLTPRIRLYAWGGLTSWSAGPAQGPGRRVAIALAGPVTGMVLGAACFLGGRAVPGEHVLAQRVLADFSWVSGLWGIVNLVPVLPLDGGVACEALLARFAPGHEVQGARLVSVVAGAAFGALALASDPSFRMAGLFSLALGLDSARRFVLTRRERRDEALRARLSPGFTAAIDARDGDALVAKATRALPEAALAVTRTWITSHLIIGHALRGAFADAAAALKAAPADDETAVRNESFVVQLAVLARKRALAVAAGQDPEAWSRSPHDEDDPWKAACARLRGAHDAAVDAVSFARVREAASILERDADAAPLGEALLDRAPDPDLAFALACSWAAAGDAPRAAACATRAVTLGFRDWERAASAEPLATPAGSRARAVFDSARAHDQGDATG